MRVGRPVLQFALTGLVTLVVVTVGGVFAFRSTGTRESVREARALTEAIAVGAIEPALSDGLLAGDRAAVARVDRVARSRVVRDPVVRVKLWSPQGRIVYSDEARLVGAQYRLAADDLEALRTGRVVAEISDLSRPENRYERRAGKLLEVYLPVHTPSGSPLLFESYVRYSSVVADGRDIWRSFAPALLAALAALWLLQVFPALSLARRLDGDRRERELLLQRAIEASDTERRRIAADLHDGVVQDLAGISLGLAARAERAQGEEAAALRSAADGTRESMRRLRSLLVEIHPPNLSTTGLEPALADLVAPLAARGVFTRVAVDPGMDLAPEAEQLVFRTAQEALRNVQAHAGASRVEVRVTGSGGRATLVVEDDGRGFTPEQAERRRAEGHLGLDLLRGRARDLGGRLAVDSEPGRGTTVTLEVGAR
jgi:two-component system, NarL family, sensor kinase